MERNIKIRNNIIEKIDAIKKEREKEIDMVFCDKSWNERMSKIYDKYDKVLIPLVIKEFYLRFPSIRNDWFKNFCSKFQDGTSKITENDFHIFERYCEEDPNNSYMTGVKYCRVSKRFITIEYVKNNTYIVDFSKID